jgi:hypothetical protein
MMIAVLSARFVCTELEHVIKHNIDFFFKYLVQFVEYFVF